MSKNEIIEARDYLIILFRNLESIFFEVTAHKSYGFCVVCNKEVDEYIYTTARKQYIKSICSTSCRSKELIQRLGCCDKAEITSCVCMYSFVCPIHGNTHIGTHD